MVGFAMAALATVLARSWGYAVFSLLALVETYGRERFRFHNWVRDSLLGYPEPPGAKHVLQAKLLNVTILAGCILVLLLLPYFVRTSNGRRLMLVGLSIILGMLALELISPHHIDAMIYHPEGPFYRAAIVYFIGAATMTAGALMQRRRSKPEVVQSV